jgi:hypothetical protein
MRDRDEIQAELYDIYNTIEELEKINNTGCPALGESPALGINEFILKRPEGFFFRSNLRDGV